MKQKRIRSLSLLVLTIMLVPGIRTSAQSLSDNGIFYHSFASPWSSSLNPAMFPESASWYVSLPRFNADLSLPFSFNDLNLKYDSQRKATIFNVTDFLNLMVERKFRFSFNSDINLLGAGISFGPGLHFTLDAGAKVTGIATIPVELTRILTEGNLNESRCLSLGTTLPIHAMSYAYASVGASFSLPDHPFSVGARLNVMDGYAMASVDNLTVDILTSPDTSSMSLRLDYLGHYSGPYPLLTEDLENGATKASIIPKNFGYTFDLGFKYSLHNLDISASLLDLGPGITWSECATTIKPKSDHQAIQFDGLDLNRINDTAYFNGWKDTLLSRLDYKAESGSYRFTPPTKMYLGVSFSILETLRVGYLFHGELSGGLFNRFGEGDFRMNNSISVNASLFDWVEVTLANSLSYDGETWAFFNPGLAVSLNPFRMVQLYAAVDYISSFYLAEMRAAHVYFGINLYGHR